MTRSMRKVGLQTRRGKLRVSFRYGVGKVKASSSSRASSSPVGGGFFHTSTFHVHRVLSGLMDGTVGCASQNDIAVRTRISRVLNGPALALDMGSAKGKVASRRGRGIFRTFAELGDTRNVRNANLKLSVARRLISLLNKRVVLRSALNGNSAFVIAVPVRPTPGRRSRRVTPTRVGRSPSLGSTRSGRKRGSNDRRIASVGGGPRFTGRGVLVLSSSGLRLRLLRRVLHHVMNSA